MIHAYVQGAAEAMAAPRLSCPFSTLPLFVAAVGLLARWFGISCGRTVQQRAVAAARSQYQGVGSTYAIKALRFQVE